MALLPRLIGIAAFLFLLDTSSATSVAPLHPSLVSRSPLLSNILSRAVKSHLSRSSRKALDVSAERGKRQSSSDDPNDTPSNEIYVSYPACGSFRCSVTWPHGLSTFVNWERSPVGGNVSVTLTSNTNGTNYVIAPSVPAISQRGYCDAGDGPGVVIPGTTCGRIEFVVPLFWHTGNYSVTVQSLSNSDVAGYTDFVVITPPTNASLSSAAAALPTDVTSVVLAHVPGPTSTDADASTEYTGPSLPAPTAGVASASASKSAAGNATGSPVRASSSSGTVSSSKSSGSSSASGSSTAASASASTNGAAGTSSSPTGGWRASVGLVVVSALWSTLL